MKASSENVNGYIREVDELALFEVEPDEIPSTLTGFSEIQSWWEEKTKIFVV